MTYSSMTEADYKYPALDPKTPREEGWLRVSETPSHEIHWQEYGNPDGLPVMVVHGGPGGGISHNHLRAFDPEKYRIIAFDQRGCGQSRPHVALDREGGLANNTTQAVVDDMEAVRHARLGDAPMYVYGGSWGSTAALAYTEQHPDKIREQILRGIFLCDKADLHFFYQGNAADLTRNDIPGAYRAYIDGEHSIPEPLRTPEMAEKYMEAWERYVSVIPEGDERKDMIAAYQKRLHDPDPSVRREAAMAWSHWEDVTSFLNPTPSAVGDGPASDEAKKEENKFEQADFALAFAGIENEFFHRSLTGKDPVLRDLLEKENLQRMKDVPTHIVQGRYDQVCFPESARRLKAHMEKEGCILSSYKETEAGHAMTEKETFLALTEIMDGIAQNQGKWKHNEVRRGPLGEATRPSGNRTLE